MHTKGKIHFALEEWDAVKHVVAKLLAIDYKEAGYAGIIPGLELKAQVLAVEGVAEEAVVCLAKATALRKELQVGLPPIDAPALNSTVERLRVALGKEKFEGLWEEGQRSELDHILSKKW